MMNDLQFEEIIRYISGKEIKKDTNTDPILKRLRLLKQEDKIFSDVFTEENGEKLQYIQLVQEGGGTLGISLVGFCFVMEYVGIRFTKLAGTSAGAINTLLMAALGKSKTEAVTPELFRIIRNMDLFSFVDGNPLAKRIIKSIISKDGWFKVALMGYALLLVALTLIFPVVSAFAMIGKSVYFILLAVFLLLTGMIVFLLLKFKKARFGINPGNVFQKFLEKILASKNITNKLQLDRIAKFYIDENGFVEGNSNYHFQLRDAGKRENDLILQQLNEQYHKNVYYENTLKGLEANYTFVTVDIASERKIELPAHAGLYWKNASLNVNPAVFVRASMAIPLFFEPVIVSIDQTDENIIQNWGNIFVGRDSIPDKGIFIDGGSISNFPISIFHNSSIVIPRLPVFGLRMKDAKTDTSPQINSFWNYAGKILNTMKSNFDKDFLSKNNFYEKYSIADIATFETKANWLDFNMDEETKKALFLKGVESALDFLEKFDWLEYKKGRAKVYFESNLS
ncbi:MAG: patatin-like phospholipase family protein [Kaistella sp.]|nr:patatin-like phospholipase family protein [Kaistella sp.]